MNEYTEEIIKSKIDSNLNIRLQKYFFDVFEGKNKNALPYLSSKSNRKTTEYGYSFRNMRDSATFSLSNPVPEILIELFLATRNSLLPLTNANLPDTFDTCLVNLYTNEVDLFPHVDKDPLQAKIENRPFYFGEHILGVTLLADSKGGFYIQKFEKEEPKIYNPAKAIHLEEENGTSYLLSNKTRYFPWHHGVSTIKIARLSATFRTLYQVNKSDSSSAMRMHVPLRHYLSAKKILL